MFLLKLHVFTLTLYGLIFGLHAVVCPKGQRIIVSGRKENCEDCQSGYFQNEENPSQICQPCTKCDEVSGSFLWKTCTKTSNTICKCHEGFVKMDEDFSTCQCKAGFGKASGECRECKHGSFSKSIDSPCKEWKKCKSGVKVNGSRTSDVICNETPQTDTSVDASPTVGKVVSSETVAQAEEHTRTRGLLTTAATTITATTRQITHPNSKVQPSSPSSTADSFGFLVTFATVGLLVFTVMILKLYFGFYKEKLESTQKHESLCRRPVEEIGGGSQVSLKMDPEEN